MIASSVSVDVNIRGTSEKIRGGFQAGDTPGGITDCTALATDFAPVRRWRQAASTLAKKACRFGVADGSCHSAMVEVASEIWAGFLTVPFVGNPFMPKKRQVERPWHRGAALFLTMFVDHPRV
jgi:hypothetical protein